MRHRRHLVGGLLLISALLCLLGALAEAKPFELTDREPEYVPRTYTDEMLPRPQLTGIKFEHLNTTVMMLNIYWPPLWTESVRSKFAIFNNRKKPGRANLVNPETFVTLGSGLYQYGPYHFDLDDILASGFDPNQRIVILIPGFFSPTEADWVREVRLKWLAADEQANVIQVDWSNSNWGAYWSAVSNTVLVARQLTIFLHYLAELGGSSLKDPEFLGRIHLIGHSLGAHISGFVGKDLGGQVGRITGLDPAGPSFDQLKRNQRLDRNDARLVEVMHTNSGRIRYLNFIASASLQALGKVTFAEKLFDSSSSSYTGEGDTAWYGIDENIGHLDYYANNGRNQPNCAGLIHVCDHLRAYIIYSDLLSFQFALNKSQSTEMLRKSMGVGNEGDDDEAESKGLEINRLYAFKSADYESFISGTNFVINCPELMDVQKHLNDTEVGKNFNRCSMPLFDVLKPLDELIEELKTVYGIDMEPDLEHEPIPTATTNAPTTNASTTNPPTTSDGNQGDKNEDEPLVKPARPQSASYYFKTSAIEGDLVGDHYLLKIYLQKDLLWDPEVCSLRALIVLSNDEKISLELSKILHPGISQSVLAIPFVYPKSLDSREQFNKLMRLVKQGEWASLDESRPTERAGPREFDELFGELFPTKILLSMGKPKSRSVFGTVKDATYKIIKQGDLSACSLTIEMLEVHPIVHGLERNFGALYGRDIFLGADHESSLPILCTRDQVRLLSEQDKFVATLSADTISSVGVGLEAALLD